MHSSSERDSTRVPSGTAGLHRRIDWQSAAWAGAIAGAVFMMMEMMLVWLVQGMSPWGPPRMMAAMLLGKQVLPPPDDFSAMAMLVAMMIHIPLSIVYGLILAWAVKRLETGAAVLVGMVFGGMLYLVNFYLIAPILFPWFEMARNWISVFSHAMYGIVLAVAYVALRKSRA